MRPAARGWAPAVALALATGLALAGFACDAGDRPEDRRTRALDALVAAYPDHLAGHDGKSLIWHDGTRMPVDDGRRGKSPQELLDSPDILDMFAYEYPLGEPVPPPPLHDPGRIRYEPLFLRMYGDCKAGEVDPKLRRVEWFPEEGGGSVPITTVNGADRALERVLAELQELPTSYRRYLIPSAGTFNCRTIAGTDRRSMHAFAAAIDISVEHAHYWRWQSPDESGERRWRNRIPYRIVEIFERHGFVWGGRWHHFDTMHFEYRPEIIALARERRGEEGG